MGQRVNQKRTDKQKKNVPKNVHVKESAVVVKQTSESKAVKMVQPKRMARVVGAGALFAAGYLTFGKLMHRHALHHNRKKEKLQTLSTPTFADCGLPVQEVSIYTTRHADERLKLHATVLEQEHMTHKWAVLVHGYKTRAEFLVREAEHFYQKGYNVLLPDLRAHGKSEGEYISMGWYDRLDIIDWINAVVLPLDEAAEIVLFGISMGASTVMMAAGEETLPEQVKVIVADCGYTSVNDILSHHMKQEFGLPKVFLSPANTIQKLQHDFDFKQASAIKQLARNTRPIMFIHGTNDEFVPFAMVHDLAAASKTDKRVLTISGAGHAEDTNAGDAFWRPVFSFIDEYIQ